MIVVRTHVPVVQDNPIENLVPNSNLTPYDSFFCRILFFVPAVAVAALT